jgi:hypothetical protein
MPIAEHGAQPKKHGERDDDERDCRETADFHGAEER